MAQANHIPLPRDYSRCPARKARVLSRKAARAGKSARLFLAIAFPPALAF